MDPIHEPLVELWWQRDRRYANSRTIHSPESVAAVRSWRQQEVTAYGASREMSKAVADWQQPHRR